MRCFAALTAEQKQKYLERFSETCQKALTRWSSKSVQNRIALTLGRWEFVVNTWIPQIEAQNAVAENQLWSAPVVERAIMHYLTVTVSLLLISIFFLSSYVSRAQLQVFKTHSDAFICADTLYDRFASLANCVNNFCFNPDDGSKAGPILMIKSGLRETLTRQVEQRKCLDHPPRFWHGLIDHPTLHSCRRLQPKKEEEANHHLGSRRTQAHA